VALTVRVLLVVSSSWLAGTERHVVELAAGLRACGVEAEVACAPGGGGLDATLAGRGVPVHPIELEGPGVGLGRCLPRLAALARDFDLLHAHLSQATAAAVAARALVGRSVVETRHFIALAYEARPWPRRLLGQARRAMLDRMVALTIAPSRAVAETVGGEVTVIPHGISIPDRQAEGPDAARFVTVGRLGHDRDHRLVLEAFAKALPELPAAATLTVVGDGQRGTWLRALCDQLGVGGRVRFTGWMDDPLPELLVADVFVATPYRVDRVDGKEPATEAYGLAALEAMAAGLPVVGSVRGALSEFVDDGRTGCLVEPDPGAFAAAMVELAADRRRRRAMGAAGRRWARDHFSADRMARRTMDAYRRVVEDARSPNVLRVYHSAVVGGWRERDRELRRRGAQVTLVSPRAWREGGRRVLLDPGVDRFVVPAATVGRHPAVFAYNPLPLLRVLRRQRFDHIDVHEEPCSLAAAEVRLLRRWLQPRSRLLLYSAQNIPKRYPPPFRQFESGALAEAVGVYVCNRAAGDILRDKGFRGVVKVLPLGVDVQRFAPRHEQNRPVGTRSLCVGYVGRLTPEKGVDVLLRAAAEQPGWRLQIVGDGPARSDLEGLAGRLGLHGRVAFTAARPHHALPELYRELDALAIPSLPTPRWQEQFGRVAVEAMASGVPIVASASGSLPEVVGDAGLLVPSGDPAALREALTELANNPRRRSELGERGRARSARFSWASVAQAHLALYQEVGA
jgi:glycosyltransferase involved in cell wall biosynthesis